MRSQRAWLYGVLAIITLVILWPFATMHSFASYATRPLWDKDPAPSQLIKQYKVDSDDDVTPKELCSMHGFSLREHPAQVWDAVSPRSSGRRGAPRYQLD